MAPDVRILQARDAAPHDQLMFTFVLNTVEGQA
jgi:hypothetical protein